ncbi:MAG: tetratricopeptide repeat protein [Pseudomonadota bacterium]
MPTPREPDDMRPAESINTDLGALRDLEASQWRPGWSRQFALLLMLVAVLVALAFFARQPERAAAPVVLNAGVVAGGAETPQWIAPALEQALNTTLSAGNQLVVLRPTGATPPFSKYGSDASVRAQRAADWRLSATIDPPGDDQLIVVRLTLAPLREAGETRTAELVGPMGAVGDLTVRSADQVYAWLGVGAATRDQVSQARLEIPSAASQAYGEGVAALHAGRGRDALAHFERADSIEPQNAAILDGLSDAWSQLGFANNAIRESGRALDAAAGLSRKRQLELEAQLASRSEDWARAQQVFSALKEFHPDNLDYHLALAESYSSLDDGEGFLARIADARRLPSPADKDPRIDLTEAWYWYGVGDYAKCLELARDAEREARARDNQYARAEAMVSMGRCDNNYDPAILLEARKLFVDLDLPAREPEILRQLAEHERAEGRMLECTAYLEESVELARSMGNEPQEAASLNSLAVAYDLRGWLDRGLNLKRELAQYQLERGNRKRYAITLENIGVSLFKLGRYDEALALSQQAEAEFRDVDDRIGLAWLPYRRGQIALRQGRIGDAEVLIRQAITNAETRPEGNLDLESRFEVALQHFYAGRFDDAEAVMSRANEEYRTLRLNFNVVVSEIALARIDRQQRQIDEARAHLREAARLMDEAATDDALWLAVEAADFDMSDSDEERMAACARLADRIDGQQYSEYVLRARSRVAVCRARFDGQRLDDSLAALDVVLADAVRLGVFEARLDAMLAKAALLQRAGHTAEASEILVRANRLSQPAGWQARPMVDHYESVAAVAGSLR